MTKKRPRRLEILGHAVLRRSRLLQSADKHAQQATIDSTVEAIRHAGFTITVLQREQLRKAPPFVRPLVVGRAQ